VTEGDLDERESQLGNEREKKNRGETANQGEGERKEKKKIEGKVERPGEGGKRIGGKKQIDEKEGEERL